MEKKDIEIPFGAFDSELGGFEYTIPEGYKAEIKDGKVVVRKTESEDERIRKALLFLVENSKHTKGITTYKNTTWGEMNSWLEKQGEQSPITDDKDVEKAAEEYRNFRMACGIKDPTELSEIEEAFYEGAIRTFDRMKEQKPVEHNPRWTELTWEDINYLEELMNQVHSEYRNGIGQESFGKEVLEQFREYKADEHSDIGKTEQKPAEWSEEDESNSNDIRSIIFENCRAEEASRLIEWLISLKDRALPQPKQEWSEEDEDMCYKAIAVINRLCAEGKDYVWSIKTLKTLFYWFKSLKERVQPQTTWKPSDEQRKGIECAIKTLQHQLNVGDKRLNSLYGALKKLKG